jgi:streptogramin lyase
VTETTTGEQRLRLTLEGDVLFDTNKSDLKPGAILALQKIKSTVIDAHPGAQLDVEGHTDDRASVEYNLSLSDRRAGSVAGWLQQNGVPSERIARHGYGESHPRVPNTSDANRAKNRRVEIVVSWGPEHAATAQGPTCPVAQACCDLGVPTGCFGKTLGPRGWGADLSSLSLEDVQSVLRLNACTATRSPAVWITSTDEDKIARLDERDGTQVFRVETYGDFPQRTAVAADGSVWITNRNSGSYVHLAADGKLLCSSAYKTCQTRAAAIDSRGNAWIGCYDKGELIQVHPTETQGTVEVHGNDANVKVAAPRCKEVGHVKLDRVRPYGLAADREGGLWVGVDGGLIAKVDATSARVVGTFDPQEDPKIKDAKGCWRPYGITIDRDGNPWYANKGCGNVVKLDGRSGKVIGVFPGGPEGLDAPRALGCDRQGHVWVSENNSHFVDELRPDGSWVRRVDVAACGKNPGPLGIGVDSEGDLWVALQYANKVMQFRTDGTVIGCYPDGVKTPLFRNPYTYSDFTGAALQMSGSDQGKLRVRFDHPERASWRMVSFRFASPSPTSLCLRARAGDSDQSMGVWSEAECPSAAAWSAGRMPLGGAQGLPGRVLEVEIELSSSDPAVTPLLSDLTAAALPMSR